MFSNIYLDVYQVVQLVDCIVKGGSAFEKTVKLPFSVTVLFYMNENESHFRSM